MKNLTQNEIDILKVAAVTAYITFELIDFRDLREYSKKEYYLNFTSTGEDFWFDSNQTNNGISIQLGPQLKYKKDVKVVLYNQISFLFENYETEN